MSRPFSTIRTTPSNLTRAAHCHAMKHEVGGIRNKQRRGNPSRQHWPDLGNPSGPGRTVIVGATHGYSVYQRAEYVRSMARIGKPAAA